MEYSPLHVILLLISLIPVTHAQGTPKAVFSIDPRTHVYRRTYVAFICDIQGGGDTEWTYSWYKNNVHIEVFDSRKRYFHIPSVIVSDSGNYTCRGNSSDSPSSVISDAVTFTVSELPDVIMSISPHNWVTEGDSVTLNWEVTDPSTNWKFTWFKSHDFSSFSDTRVHDGKIFNEHSYTLSSASREDTGVYECIAQREDMSYITVIVSPPLWITGESPPVSLIINPKRTQHFTNDSLSLTCEDQSNSTVPKLRRYRHGERVSDCSWWGSVTRSTCTISSLALYNTGFYWCVSESGEMSNPVNITVHDGDVILDSPVHPVTEGRSLTLRCLYRNTKTSNLRADFYKDGSVLQTQTTGEMIIHKVSKSDEGFYHCKHPERGESPKSWVAVRRESPPVSLIINPNRTEHFTNDSLSLSCEDQSNSTEHTVRRYTLSDGESDCSWWGSVTRSTCTISSLSLNDTGVYWCVSESGENSNPVNITVHAHTDEERMRNAVI